MANLIHKLAKKAPPISARLLLRHSPSLISHQSSLTTFDLHDYPKNPLPHTLLNPILHVNSVKQTKHSYPNYSIGFFLNPVPSTGFDRLGQMDEEEGDADTGIIRADSVKKKRKKKMNKHKYKKLRKRLRRKSRS